MLGSSSTVPGVPAGWCWEVKWDGWRAVVYVDGGGVKVRTRPGREVSDSLPELVGPVGPPGGVGGLPSSMGSAHEGLLLGQGRGRLSTAARWGWRRPLPCSA